jgi:hypothetical protein
MTSTENYAADACRAVDNLAAHLVAEATTNDDALAAAVLCLKAKDAIIEACPGDLPLSVRWGEASTTDYPPVKPTVTPADLPGSEDDEAEEDDEDGGAEREAPVLPEPSPTPDTQTEPDAVLV